MSDLGMEYNFVKKTELVRGVQVKSTNALTIMEDLGPEATLRVDQIMVWVSRGTLSDVRIPQMVFHFTAHGVTLRVQEGEVLIFDTLKNDLRMSRVMTLEGFRKEYATFDPRRDDD